MIIYMATNKVNGKLYVGQTVNSLEQRKGEHIRRSSLNNDNLYFPTFTDATKFLGVVKTTISNRIRRNVKGYSYVNI